MQLFADIRLQIISQNPWSSEVIWRFKELNEFQAYNVNNNSKIIAGLVAVAHDNCSNFRLALHRSVPTYPFSP